LPPTVPQNTSAALIWTLRRACVAGSRCASTDGQCRIGYDARWLRTRRI